MMKFSLIFILTFLLIGLCRGDEDLDASKVDHIKLAQIWPITQCRKFQQSPRHDCQIQKFAGPNSKFTKSWTIHGLWPARNSGQTLQKCGDSKAKVNAMMSSVLRRLYDTWPSFALEFNDMDFWQYEYDKHGTCSIGLPKINEMTDYFVTTVSLARLYDIGKILEKKRIVNGEKYYFTTIQTIISQKLKANTTVACIEDEVTHDKLLWQVYICFDTNFNVIDCETKNINCGDGEVLYPNKL